MTLAVHRQGSMDWVMVLDMDMWTWDMGMDEGMEGRREGGRENG